MLEPRSRKRSVGAGLAAVHAVPCFGFAALLAVVLAAAAGCGASDRPPATPEQAVMAFARSINQGKLEAAYALMSSKYKERVSFEAFKKSLTENPRETLALTHALTHLQPGTRQEAVVRYDDDAEILLRREGEQWLVASAVVDYYDQSSPRAAIASFVRALENKRYDVVLRLIPNADKEGITTQRMEETWSGPGREDLERMLHNLREHKDAPIELAGNRATMPYGDRMRVQLLYEDGVWKIEDPE